MSAEQPLRSALRAAAEAVGAEASDAQLDRIAPLAAALLRNELRSPDQVELGETEPAFGLRFDARAHREDGPQ